MNRRNPFHGDIIFFLSFSLSLLGSTYPSKTILHFLISFPPHKSSRSNFKSSSSSSSSPHPFPSSSPTLAETTSAASTYSNLEDSFKTGKFFSNEELNNLETLQKFRYFQELESGFIWVRVMRQEEMDMTVELLAESFDESLLIPAGYVSLLSFLVKQCLIVRRAVMPHAVTLVGFYKRKGEGEGYGEKEEDVEDEFAGTVEVCFNKRSANSSLPTPTPPKNSPYICNMTVKEPLRRRGIGWNLLKASEVLISQMSGIREVYVHCRRSIWLPSKCIRKQGTPLLRQKVFGPLDVAET